MRELKSQDLSIMATAAEKQAGEGPRMPGEELGTSKIQEGSIGEQNTQTTNCQ